MSVNTQPSPQGSIESVLVENRVFAPPASVAATARIGSMDAYNALCQEAEQDFEGYWAKCAKEHVQWTKPFTPDFGPEQSAVF